MRATATASGAACIDHSAEGLDIPRVSNAQASRGQWPSGRSDERVVERRAGLTADLEKVLEPSVVTSAVARTTSLDQSVGAGGRPVKNRGALIDPGSERARATPSDWSAVVRTLRPTTDSPSSTTTSVKVPPTSTPTTRDTGLASAGNGSDRRPFTKPKCHEIHRGNTGRRADNTCGRDFA